MTDHYLFEMLQQNASLEQQNTKLNEALARGEAEIEELRSLVRDFADALIEHTTAIDYTPSAFDTLPQKVQRSRQVIRGLHLIKTG